MQEECTQNITNDDNFHSRLRKVRKHLGLSQQEFSKILGFASNAQISNLERGENEPTSDLLRKLAQHFSIDIHWLITGQVAPSANKAAKYRLALTKLGKYILADAARILEQKEFVEDELQRLLKLKAKGNNISDEQITQTQAVVISDNQRLLELEKDRVWTENAMREESAIQEEFEKSKDKKKP